MKGKKETTKRDNGNGKSKVLAVKDNMEFGSILVNQVIDSIVADFKAGKMGRLA